MTNYVLIGNSAAAVGCIEGIRQIDPEGAVTVVSREPYHTYSRPLISYLLCGKTDEQRMKYRPDDFYEKNNAAFLPGRTAEAVDPQAKTVALDDGTILPYDKLLIAAGSTPFVPPIDGVESVKNRFSFMSLDDAHALEKAAAPESRVLVLGAGLIGLKCAEGLAKRVGSLTVVDLADRILPNVLDAEAARLVQKHLEAHGISFRLSDSVQSFAPGAALLKSGETLSFDILVTAVGVRPNTALAVQAGCEVNRGIVTDDGCRTSVPDIYAAGDCTESLDITTGARRVLALLPNAYMQGECAGVHMAAEAVGTTTSVRYNRAIPMNAVGFFGLSIITAGDYQGEEYIAEKESEETYKKLVTRDGLLKGYILVGNVARAGIYTSLIREKTPLDTIDFELIREKPQLMAFSRRERKRILSAAE